LPHARRESTCCAKRSQHGTGSLWGCGPTVPTEARSTGARTTNAIERLHEEFKRRIKTQTVLPSAETAAMLFWALLASGQINMRKVDGWQTLATTTIDQPIDLAA
jgi:putative transposase